MGKPNVLEACGFSAFLVSSSLYQSSYNMKKLLFAVLVLAGLSARSQDLGYYLPQQVIIIRPYPNPKK